MERYTSKSTTTKEGNRGLPDRPNWGIFTILDARDAKNHADAYKKHWRKETWIRWFKFLPTIGVYYDKETREYKDKG